MPDHFLLQCKVNVLRTVSGKALLSSKGLGFDGVLLLVALVFYRYRFTGFSGIRFQKRASKVKVLDRDILDY